MASASSSASRTSPGAWCELPRARPVTPGMTDENQPLPAHAPSIPPALFGEAQRPSPPFIRGSSRARCMPDPRSDRGHSRPLTRQRKDGGLHDHWSGRVQSQPSKLVVPPPRPRDCLGQARRVKARPLHGRFTSLDTRPRPEGWQLSRERGGAGHVTACTKRLENLRSA